MQPFGNLIRKNYLILIEFEVKFLKNALIVEEEKLYELNII